MKAIVCEEYGSPDVLQYKEVEKPVPKDNEALVRIHATSMNAVDLETLRGDPVVRITSPRKPMYRILGSDVAGRIEAVGRNVRQFQQGDDIWGDLSELGFGTFAEYVCIPENALRRKPASMTFEQAAAIPTGAVLALQNLRGAAPASPSLFLSNKGQIRPGQKVLINGAGGSVGTFAIQIAKHFGAEVTAVDSARKLDMLRSIGADHVIDYTEEDYTRTGKRYDLILDVVAYRSLFAYKRALNPNGIFVFIGGPSIGILRALFLAPLISFTGRKKMGTVMWEPNHKEDMEILKAFFEAGKVVPVIDRTYPLNEVPEAMRYLARGHPLGKIVIGVEHGNKS
jgi:NADPH:quinone reductase-like Zn-dependent oxidoreductase